MNLSSEQLQCTIQFVHEPSIVVHHDGKIIAWNQAMEEQTGLSFGEVLEQDSSAILYSRRKKTPISEALQTGKSIKERFQFSIKKSKKNIEAWLIANPIVSGDKTVGVFAQFHSIKEKEALAEARAMQNAINRSQAVIFFEPDGTIIRANENFLATVGYSLDEVQGKHHGIFVDSAYRSSNAYKKFWKRLQAGEFVSDRFKRFSKSGQEIWIQASYNPIFDAEGKVIRVVKYASDITEEMAKQHEYEGMVSAIDRAQAVIFFEPDGTIVKANENFLATVGYSLDEIQGKHHSIFVDEKYGKSKKYREFWEKLRAGEFVSDRFKRFSKSGDEVWIQASYNPIFNAEGRVTEVVKYASDITEEIAQQSEYEGMVSAIDRAQAVIFFEPDGTIVKANENFLATVGYSLDEIQGRHHGIFVDERYRASREYKNFWKRLQAGEYISDRFKRFSKSGDEVWIQASYNPIFDAEGRVTKVVKYASDITEEMNDQLTKEGMVTAIDRVQAMILFELDGTIVDANENFIKTMGYSLEEIKGQHHSMFVDKEYGSSGEYKQFWKDLGNGEFKIGEFSRLDKQNEEIWLQASYNPLFNLDGEPVRVVKYASNITEKVHMEREREQQRLQIEAVTNEAVFMVEDLVGLTVNMNSGLSAIHDANEDGLRQIQSVAAASEELASSVHEIAKKSEEADVRSQKAEDELNETFSLVKKISSSADDVSGIVGLINDVARQTNLLALNAAIEAARAGEAGRGFGVVASEVKELSSQTRRATRDITERIQMMQEAIKEGSDSIGSVVTSVQDMRQLVGAISTAMLEQSSVTEELSKNGEYAVGKNKDIVEKTGNIEADVQQVVQKVTGVSKLLESLK